MKSIHAFPNLGAVWNLLSSAFIIGLWRSVDANVVSGSNHNLNFISQFISYSCIFEFIMPCDNRWRLVKRKSEDILPHENSKPKTNTKFFLSKELNCFSCRQLWCCVWEWTSKQWPCASKKTRGSHSQRIAPPIERTFCQTNKRPILVIPLILLFVLYYINI